MRVAALYDIHGNLPALEAILEEVERSAVDVIVVGGDVAWGPLPRPTVQALMDLGDRARFVMGNADREVAARHDESRGLEPWVAEVNLWCADQLTRAQMEFLEDFKATVVVDVDGLGPTLFCHGSPRSDEATFTAATSDERVSELLDATEQATVVCGHTHAQFDRSVGPWRVINAGSVGLPFGQPGAYWALLGPDVELRRTPYDLERTAARVRASGVPDAGGFADHILAPPPEPPAEWA